MKVLIACEESQRITIEMRKLGIVCYSCDIDEPSGGHPEWHILHDVLPYIDGDCTFTTMDGQEHTIVGDIQQWANGIFSSPTLLVLILLFPAIDGLMQKNMEKKLFSA